MHSRISPTAMASMHCVKPWALYDKIKIKPAWGLSSISKQIVVCSLKGQKKEQTGSTTESIRKDRCTTINNCWLSVLPTFLDLFIPKVFESTQLNWKSYISLESVPDFYASDMLLQPFPQTPKSTPVLCPLTRCWSWWCFVGGAAAISAAVVLQAVETGLMLTGGWQGATRNLQEWSSLKTARDQFHELTHKLLLIKTSGWKPPKQLLTEFLTTPFHLRMEIKEQTSHLPTILCPSSVLRRTICIFTLVPLTEARTPSTFVQTLNTEPHKT